MRFTGARGGAPGGAAPTTRPPLRGYLRRQAIPWLCSTLMLFIDLLAFDARKLAFMLLRNGCNVNAIDLRVVRCRRDGEVEGGLYAACVHRRPCGSQSSTSRTTRAFQRSSETHPLYLRPMCSFPTPKDNHKHRSQHASSRRTRIDARRIDARLSHLMSIARAHTHTRSTHKTRGFSYAYELTGPL
eukprot:scaffold36620_cov32-Prasinocladus_malaysianus.AAC.3